MKRFLCAIALALAVLAPGSARARTVFGFVAPVGAEQAAELQSDLLARLERTRRYALLEVAGYDSPQVACASDQRLEKAAQLIVEKEGKFSAELHVRDCASGVADPLEVRASSSKLSSLAGALRADFIEAYALLVNLEAEGEVLLADVGPEEKVAVGDLLYSYVRGEDGTFHLARRLRVRSYDEGRFRSRLEEIFHLPGAGAPRAGEQLSPRALFHGGARIVSAPPVATMATRRIAGPAELIGGGSFVPPLPEARLQARHELRSAPGDSIGRSLNAWLEMEGGARLICTWKGPAATYRVTLGATSLEIESLEPSPEPVATLPLAEPIEPGVPVRILISWLGPWTEFYVGGRFVGGLEDLRLAARAFELGASGAVRFRAPQLFELTMRP